MRRRIATIVLAALFGAGAAALTCGYQTGAAQCPDGGHTHLG